MILTASRPEAPPRKRFISRIREIVDDYHRGLKPAGAWAEVLAALREMDRRIETGPPPPPPDEDNVLMKAGGVK